MFIPYAGSGFFHPGSRIWKNFPGPDPGSGSVTLNQHMNFWSIFNQKIVTKLSEKWSEMFIPDRNFVTFRVPDPGVKKDWIQDPEIPSATLPIDPPDTDKFFLWWISWMMQLCYFYRRRLALTYQSWRSCIPTTVGSKRDGAHYPSIQMEILFKGTFVPETLSAKINSGNFLSKNSYILRKLFCITTGLNR